MRSISVEDFLSIHAHDSPVISCYPKKMQTILFRFKQSIEYIAEMIDILLTFGFLPTLGTSYAATGIIDWNVLLIAVPVGLITDGILHSNNTRDITTDRRAGITTMAMSLGTRWAAWLYGFEMIYPFAWVGICSMAGILPIHTIVIFMTLPIAMGCAKTMKNSVGQNPMLIADLDVRTANLQMLFSLLLSASLIAAKFF